jgi:hypothetical protein
LTGPDGNEPARTLGEAVDAVRWSYDPSQRLLSPLVETARYFEDFPWDGEPAEVPQAMEEGV